MTNPTIKDVAREAGVSIASVSRVLNNEGYSSDTMKKKVIEAAAELNYFKNDIAKSLKTNKTNTVGIIIPDIANPFFMTMLKGLEDAIADTQLNLIFTSGMENTQKEKELLHLLIERRVDGIVLATAGLHTDLLNSILKSGIPIVLIDRKNKELLHKVDMVLEDNFEGSYQITKKLVEDGHESFGVITGLLGVSTNAERIKGFEALMKEKNLDINNEYIFHGDYSEEAGRKAVKYFLGLPNPPEAILSLNNRMTMGVIKELKELHLTEEDEFTIASYGEVEFQKYFSNLKIYTVRQNPYEMGIKVGEIMIDRLLKKEEKKLNEIYLSPTFNFESKN